MKMHPFEVENPKDEGIKPWCSPASKKRNCETSRC